MQRRRELLHATLGSTIDAMLNNRAVSDARIAAACEEKRVPMALGLVEGDSQERSWLDYLGHRVLWIANLAKKLEDRLIVCAHMQEPGHQRVDITPEAKRVEALARELRAAVCIVQSTKRAV